MAVELRRSRCKGQGSLDVHCDVVEVVRAFVEDQLV